MDLSSLPVEGLTADTGDDNRGGDRVRGVVRVQVNIIGGRSALSGVLPAALLYSTVQVQHSIISFREMPTYCIVGATLLTISKSPQANHVYKERLKGTTVIAPPDSPWQLPTSQLQGRMEGIKVYLLQPLQKICDRHLLSD
jgi:hypothetical protein